ncbi:MAG: hypothetical protein AAFY17_09425 [Cyanobacteria bacterium J06642_11]
MAGIGIKTAKHQIIPWHLKELFTPFRRLTMQEQTTGAVTNFNGMEKLSTVPTNNSIEPIHGRPWGSIPSISSSNRSAIQQQIILTFAQISCLLKRGNS